MKLAIRKNLINVLAFVGFIWLIYLVSLALKVMSWDLVNYGMVPRTARGLIGIFTMPFLHDGLDHLLGNTVPLAVLLFMLATSRSNARRIVLALIIVSGIFTWLVGISSPVVGASGLIYALTAYLITAGLHERQLLSAATAVLVGVLYGSTLFWNLLPTAGKTVAWDAHLLGAAAGAVYAHLTLRRKPTKLRDTRPSEDRSIAAPSAIVE